MKTLDLETEVVTRRYQERHLIGRDLSAVVGDVDRLRQKNKSVGSVSKVYLNRVDFGDDELEVTVTLRRKDFLGSSL